MNIELPRWLDELERMLESVNTLRPADPQVAAARGMALIVHELRRMNTDAPIPRSRSALLDQLQRLTAEQLQSVRVRTLYYATHELVTLLAHRNLRKDAVAREEAVLYVHERLQRDDFRRIDAFDPSHGASFKTYIWQVVSRLLIDFVRSRKPQREADAASADSLADHEQNPEADLSEAQLRELISVLFADNASSLAGRSALRDRLRAHLDLTSTERLFLKAIFQHDLSIDEVRRLPGFEMNSAEAWRYYYRLLERLLECFKNADALEALRSLASPGEPLLEIAIERELARIEVTKIRYVKHLTTESAACHAEWRGLLAAGTIGDSLTRLRKKLAPWFTPINATTLVADDQLRDMHELWAKEESGPVHLPGVDETFVISRTQWTVLRKRYAGKNSGDRSYMDHDVDATDAAGRGQES
jgi:DNA-directed RNA polymerase specialized sigma24 family protein